MPISSISIQAPLDLSKYTDESTLSVELKLTGIVEPRISTAPLRPLTPETSEGFAVVDFVENTLGDSLFAWQREFLIRALELLPDGTHRFRTVLLIVARQNGKSTLLSYVDAYWLSTGQTILGTSSSLQTAIDVWELTVEVVEAHPEIYGPVKVYRRNGGVQLIVPKLKSWYKVAAVNRKTGRSQTISRLVLDEAREMLDDEGYTAAAGATVAQADAQVFLISNAGDSRSIVLNTARARALTGTDPFLGIFEWSAPDDAELTDREAWAQANPSLGQGVTERALEANLKEFTPAKFATEHLCRFTIANVDELVTGLQWKNCYSPGTLDAHRDRVAACLDVSTDGRHATLCAAVQLSDGRVRVEPVQAWADTAECLTDLPGLLARMAPRKIGIYASGPVAALAQDLKSIPNLVEIKSETNSACMGFIELINAGRLYHNGEELLTSHLLNAKKQKSGDGWRFDRAQPVHCDAAYAAAGAVHLARTIQVPNDEPLEILFARSR